MLQMMRLSVILCMCLYICYVFIGIEAVCDPPLCLYLQKLMKDFPDAKVILTIQDSEELWLNDCRTFLHPSYTGISGVKQFISEKIPRYLLFHLSPTMQNYVSHFESPLFKELLGTQDFEDGELMKWSYREHNDIVRLTVPYEQLLIMNVKDGWEPLCNFLGCSIPDEPFPCEKNDSYSYQLLYRWSFGRKCFQEGFNNICFLVFLAGFGVLMALMFN